MEKKVSDFKDDVWQNIKREDKKKVKHTCKCRRVKKADRLDDVRLVGSLSILILKFFVLLNVLVITGRML